MRISITPDAAACLAAGVEPQDHLEVDVAALAAEDRALIAGRLDTSVTPPRYRGSVVATLAGLLAHARDAQAQVAREAEQQARRKAAQEDVRAAGRAAIDAALAAHETRTEARTLTHLGRRRSFEALVRVLPSPYYASPEQQEQIDAWGQEIARRNADLEAALEAEIAAEVAAGVAARAWLSGTELAERYHVHARHQPMTIVSDDGSTLVLASSYTPGGTVQARFTVDLTAAQPCAKLSYIAGTESYDAALYSLSDGVMTVPGAHWVARVIDPAAPKPVYDFCERVPGGVNPDGFSAGDILVWGTAPDRKGRKQRYDRLVIEVRDNGLCVAKVGDYTEARKLRKALLA